MNSTEGQRAAAKLPEAELLAVFLRGSLSADSALEISSRLLVRFGGLRGLLHARDEHLAA